MGLAGGLSQNHRDSILLARVIELLLHLRCPRLTLLFLAAVFLMQLLALGDLLLQGGDLIVDVAHQEAGKFHWEGSRKDTTQ